MPYTYEKDKNGRWRTRGNAAGSVPMSGGSGFGPAKPTPQRKESKDKPWWWHVTPQGIGNNLKYEADRAKRFNKPRPTDRKPVLPIMQFLPPAARQVVAGATVRAGSDAALAGVNLAQRAWGNYNRLPPALKAVAGAVPVAALPALGLFGPSRDPESTPAGKAILAVSKAGTKALGARLPEEMSPSDRDVYEAIPAGVAANVALAPVPFLRAGQAIKGAGVAAKVARWGANTAANEAAANLVTDNTMGGPSSLLKAVGVPVPDALSADPTRDDRISAGLREIPASMVFAGALGGAAGLLERLPHVGRALRENRTAQELNRARQKTVANGLQEPDPTTGGHNFTQTATTPPPPPPPPAPTKPVGSVLEQDAAMLGITPEALAASRGVPYNPTSQPAPAAAPTPPASIPSIEGDFTTFGKAKPGDLPQADPAMDPWQAAPAPEAPAAAAAPAPMAAPEPAAPKAPAAAADEVEPVYDPELPEIDHVALALERLDPAVVEQIVQTPGPVLPRIEEALASRQPVAPRPGLEATNLVAPTEKLAENQFLTRRDEWTNLRDDELLGVFHPEVNPGLFGEAHARTGRSFEELTREDALETLSALADSGATVIPDRLKAGIELARTRDLVADPERFQYKLNTNNKGVQKGNSLEGLERWNTSMENTVLVWEDPADGKTYVVNGHNRLAKALELGIPTLPVKRLLASTPEQARALGAMDNIASGGGTPWDAAKFFRDAGILDIDQAGKAGLPLNSGHAEKGLQLAALPDNIFQAGLTGELKEVRALELGASGLSPEKMQSVWKKYQDDKFFRTEENFPRLIDLARDTPTTAADSGGRLKQGEIPGFETAAERDLTVVKIKLVNKVKANLATDKRALKGASRNAGTLEAKGNSQIDAQTAMQAGLDAEQLGRIFDAVWWASDNKISALLNAGAEEIAAGAKADMVARRIQGELAQAAEEVVMPARAPEPVAPVEPELPMPKTAKDHEANQMLVLNRAAAQGEVRPSATPIPVPPAPPEIDVAKAARGINAQDVMGGDSQLKFAQQQRQQALDAGDATAVEAWDKEIRKVNQGRLGAAMDAQDASQTGLFGVTEYDNSMPLFDQSKLDAEEARLAAEYLERDTALQQEVARAEREAMGYHDMTFDQKKAEAGIAEGWEPKTAAETLDTRGQARYFHGSAQEIPNDAPTRDYWTDTNIFGNGFYVTDDLHTAGNAYTKKGKRQALKPEVPIKWYAANDELGRFAGATSDEVRNLTRATTDIPAPDRLRELAANLDAVAKRSGDRNGRLGQLSARLRELAESPPKPKDYKPVTYEAVEKVPIKFFDADRPIPWDEQSPEANILRAQKGELWDAVKDEWEANGSMSYGEMLDEARGSSKSLGRSRGDVTETFDGIHQQLEDKLGYGGLEHQGGARAGGGKRLHNVRIYWDPENQITLKRVGAQGPEAKPAELPPAPEPRLMSSSGYPAGSPEQQWSDRVAAGRLNPDVRAEEARAMLLTPAKLKNRLAIQAKHEKEVARVAEYNDELPGSNSPGELTQAQFDKKWGTDESKHPVLPKEPTAISDLKKHRGAELYLQWYEKEIGAKAAAPAPEAAAPPNAAETKALFDELAGQLRELDGGKLKGVSKRALDAAEKGDPEQALAEATDYANRRMAQLRTEIEDIKRRAIEEGC